MSDAPLVKYWVWRGQAYPQSWWKTPCATCGEPTDYRLEDRQDIYLAEDVERRDEEVVNTLKHILEYWNGNYNERAMSDALDHILDEAQRLLAQLGRKS